MRHPLPLGMKLPVLPDHVRLICIAELLGKSGQRLVRPLEFLPKAPKAEDFQEKFRRNADVSGKQPLELTHAEPCFRRQPRHGTGRNRKAEENAVIHRNPPQNLLKGRVTERRHLLHGAQIVQGGKAVGQADGNGPELGRPVPKTIRRFPQERRQHAGEETDSEKRPSRRPPHLAGTRHSPTDESTPLRTIEDQVHTSVGKDRKRPPPARLPMEPIGVDVPRKVLPRRHLPEGHAVRRPKNPPAPR